jgi:SAM-dependent methyltransferase
MQSFQDLYTSGEYLKLNPQWHAEESPWKVRAIMRMLVRNKLSPRSVCDVGCGVGETLRLLQQRLGKDCMFTGYEISPQAYSVCISKSNERLQFKLTEIQDDPHPAYDLMLVLDVIEHVEDYYKLLRGLRQHSEYKIFNIPLDIFVGSVLLRSLTSYRASYGHIHYFTNEIALAVLRDAGYDILDSFYSENPASTAWSEIWRAGRSSPRWAARKIAGKLIKETARIPARLLFSLHQDTGVRLFGGWKLLVLAR